MISGVGSYSSHGSYSHASSSTSSSARPRVCGASGQNKAQEKLFSVLDADGDGSLSQDETTASATSPGTGGMPLDQSDESSGSSDDRGDGRLVTAVLKRCEAGAAGCGSSRVGSQLSLSA